MKRSITFLLLLIPFVSNAQNADSVWLVNNYTKQEVYITMRDGVRLFTSIYSPKDNDANNKPHGNPDNRVPEPRLFSDKHPVLMMRTPYSVGLMEQILSALSGILIISSISGKSILWFCRMCGAGL